MAMESFGFYNDYSQLRNTLSISIRDNKYKVDLTPTDIGSVNFPDIYTPLSMYEMLMTNELLSLENYEFPAPPMEIAPILIDNKIIRPVVIE